MLEQLSPAHRKMLLEESSITEGLIAQRGYFTATKSKQLAELGFSPDQAKCVPALAIPIHGVDADIVFHQARPDNPRKNDQGKIIKYETPAGVGMRIDVPPACRADLDDPNVPLWITEGAKKADSLGARGHCCIDLIGVWNFRGMNLKGGSVELADWEKIAVKKRRIYIAFDSDVMLKPEVKAALQRLAGLLKRRGAKEILPIVIPTKNGQKMGLDDWFASGGQTRELMEAVDLSLLRGSHIIINNRNLAAVTEDALEAMVATNYPPTTFVRAGELVRIMADERGLTKIRDLDMAAVRGILARSATWARIGAKEDLTEVAPPKDVVEDLMALGSWPHLPPIIAITRSPILNKDGTLTSSPGYCPKSHMFIAGNEEWPAFEGTVGEAAEFIKSEVLGDFPFATGADLAHAIALMVLPIVRPMINGPTPLHLVDAPVQGTGKSLLAKVCLMPTMGAEISATTGTRDEEEWRKKIASSLLEGRAYVFFDNLSRKVDSDTLAGVLTSTEWNDRGLGTMTNINCPVRCVWLATTNNADLSRDILRRTVWIRLDSKEERPEDRPDSKFRHPNIEEWVPANRPAIVSALCKLVRSWRDSDNPTYSGRRLGSFEEWSKVIGGILEHAGIQGFLGNVQELRAAADSDEASWADFYMRWWIEQGKEPIKAGDLIELFRADEQLAGMLEGARGEASAKTRLGNLIRKRVGVVSGGFRIERHDTYGHALRYKLINLAGLTSKTSTLFDTTSNADLGSNIEVMEVIEVNPTHAYARAHTCEAGPGGLPTSTTSNETVDIEL